MTITNDTFADAVDARMERFMDPDALAADIAEAARRMREMKPEADARFSAQLASKRPLSPREAARIWHKSVSEVTEEAKERRFDAIWLSKRTFRIPYPEVWRCATGLQRYHGIQHPDDVVIELPSRLPERSAAARTECCVYYVRGISTGMIKIGIALDFRSRLLGLRSSSPDRLVVLATSPGQYLDEERALHKQFAKERSHGEWFHPSKRLLKHIRAIQLQTDSPVLRSQWELV